MCLRLLNLPEDPGQDVKTIHDPAGLKTQLGN